MASKTKTYKDSTSKFYRPIGSIEAHGSGADFYLKGYVETGNGYVTVYSQGHENKPDWYTRLGFLRDGVHYGRVFRYAFAPRTLVTLAVQFAADVVAGKAGAK